ncbi:MAG: OmpA family protein [Melioribacteraceae bacterium]|nr:OmpA family protein [Melioribacteraceae bacterium]
MKIYMRLITIFFIQLILMVTIIGQDVQSSLFGEADKMIQEALSNELNLLSPSYYEKAFDDYQAAKAEYKEGANLNNIKEKIENVTKYLKVAQTKSEVSKITLKNSLMARKDAAKVEAILHAPEIWLNAEEKFREAGEEVEDGDIPDAEEASKEAEDLYRSAELASIKVLYLDETWKLINTAKEEDAENYSIKTLEKATSLVKEAEKELSENRYDIDLPRSLAQQAKYEANHAIYLTRFIKDFEESEMTLEDLLLTYESPLRKIASHFDFDAKFDQPQENVANAVVQKIVDLKTSYQAASQDNADLKSEIKILKEELGGLSKEKSELDAKMAKLAETKAKYEKVNNSFTNDEAVIFKEGNNIYIRLVSLSFPVGKSTIEPANFGLLSKVQNAIKNFPNSTIVIEGHTDSYGSDEKNMELSQERASAVKQYILANMNLDQKKVMSFGYGETKPIANNETKEGRAKNRRIDLIIQNAE